MNFTDFGQSLSLTNQHLEQLRHEAALEHELQQSRFAITRIKPQARNKQAIKTSVAAKSGQL